MDGILVVVVGIEQGVQVVDVFLRNVMVRHPAFYLHDLCDDRLVGLLSYGFCLSLLVVGEGDGVSALPVFCHGRLLGELAVSEISDERDVAVPP